MKVTNPHPTRALLVVLAVGALTASLLVAAVAGKPAQASFPGTNNGLLAFVSDRSSSSRDNDDIYVMNPDGSNPPRPLTMDPAADRAPAVSPDGKKIAFVSNRADTTSFAGDIYVMDADGLGVDKNGNETKKPTRLTKNNAVSNVLSFPFGSFGRPAWSPDGKNIAFQSIQGGNADIYIMAADGSEPADVTDTSRVTRLTNNTAVDGSPVFSPDGSQIAFVSARDGNNEVYVMNADGTNQTNLTNNKPTPDHGGFDSMPEYSPDGAQIAFTSNWRLGSDGKFNYDIWVMNAKDGSNKKNLTEKSAARDVWPAWSPDATKIAFWGGQTVEGFDGDIYMMDANGDNLTDLTSNNDKGVGDLQPNWGPLADTTPPAITVPLDISQTATSSSGNQVTFDAPTATDTVDGTITPQCDHNSGDTFPLGTTQVTCTATDKAGNTSTKSFNVTITYAWSEVLQPINSDGSSIRKLGSVVPVKFQLTGDSAGITDATAKLYIAQVSHDVTGTEQEATSNASADSGNTFRYDSTNKQYVFNLATKNLSVGTWQLQIDLGDGVKHTVNISLKS